MVSHTDNHTCLMRQIHYPFLALEIRKESPTLETNKWNENICKHTFCHLESQETHLCSHNQD